MHVHSVPVRQCTCVRAAWYALGAELLKCFYSYACTHERLCRCVRSHAEAEELLKRRLGHMQQLATAAEAAALEAMRRADEQAARSEEACRLLILRSASTCILCMPGKYEQNICVGSYKCRAQKRTRTRVP